MSSLFTAISGQFGRAVVIGALLPAAIFVLAMHVFVIPMLPWEWRLITRIALLDAQWKVAALTIAAVFVAALLYVLNTSIVRFYEGYPWRKGWIGEWMTKVQAEKLAERTNTRVRARELARRLRRTAPKDSRLDKLAGARDDAAREIKSIYPQSRSVLATKLGNVIRAFETYSREQYGISAIPLWPRFVSRIRTEHAAQIDDAKTSFDVAIHLSLLSAITAVAMIGMACVYPPPLIPPRLLIWLGVRVAIAFGLTWAFYELAIDRASDWGDLVRGVFDLYRWDVLKDLGFESRPGDLDSERALWTAISRQMIFGDPELGPMLNYDPRTLTVPFSPWISLTRSVRTLPGGRQVAIVIRNRGLDTVSTVSIAEHLPSGSDYIADSAQLNGHPLREVHGVNPFFFHIGSLAANATAELTYEAELRES